MPDDQAASILPWHQRTFRWAQTNITEIDPLTYDINWWRKHWRQTCVQGVIINAGGIFAYYPSSLPFTHPAEHLAGRDLFGELVEAAREEGLAVIARMDSNRVHENVLRTHPDWIAVDLAGEPYRAGELYITCIDSPYYEQYLPQVLLEIVEMYHPDGFTDNSFSGLDRNHISYSPHARERFRRHTEMELPARVDWDDPVYRQWIKTSYQRRLEIWELNNAITRKAGGEHCLWIGMIGGDFIGQGVSFRDMKAICERTEMVMVDFQSRPALGGFKQNGEAGKLIHGLAGWDKPVIESMAQYIHGIPFRISAAPEMEARLWMAEGFTGGILPWYHHIGAYHEDRRQYHIAEPLMRWHAKNQQYLVDRQPVASVGILWSQSNADFYGRDDAEGRVSQPWQGFTRAMVRARIPYIPIHADQIGEQSKDLALLILPDLAAISDSQCQAIRDYAARGGSLIASSRTSLLNEWGDQRQDFALADLFGVHHTGKVEGFNQPESASWNQWQHHNYLRLHPEYCRRTDGPLKGNEPEFGSARHPVLEGFEQTDLLPFGGQLAVVTVDPGEVIPMTYVRPFPIYPPETAYMREPDSGLPGLVLRETPSGSRVAYLAADLDRCYSCYNLPDHSQLLANLIRWAAGDSIPLEVEGAGLIDCHLYCQENDLVLHLVNLTGTAERPLQELVKVGPLKVRVKNQSGSMASCARLLVAEKDIKLIREDGWLEFVVPSILDHEVVLIF